MAAQIVLDTSAVIAVITNEAHKQELVRVTRGMELLAPSSLPAEVGNAFSAMFKRNRISLDQARAAIAAYRQIPIRFIDIDLDQSLEISEKLGIYAYDAYVIACGLQHRAALLTLDRGQREAAEKAGAAVLEVSV
jgi:predicted nucleic acid-binding protein